MSRYTLTTATKDTTAGMIRVSELFTARPKIARRTGEDKTLEVVYSGRAYSASRMAMRGDAYSVEDAAECAAMLTAGVVAELPEPPRCFLCGGPGRFTYPEHYGAATCYRHAAPLTRRTVGVGMDSGYGVLVPERLANFTRLYRLALNYRRALDSQRARDTAAARREAARFTTNGAGEAPEHQDPTTADPSTVVHDRARCLLEAIGAPRLGRAYVVAYSAAAVSYGLAETLTQAAAMLTGTVETATAEKRLQRSRLSLTPYIGHHDRSTLADMLGVTYREPHAEHVAPLPESFGQRTRPDAYRVTTEGYKVPVPGDRFPNVSPDRATRPHEPYSVRTVEPNPSTEPAAWTRTLTASGRARLAKTAALRDSRRTAALNATTP